MNQANISTIITPLFSMDIFLAWFKIIDSRKRHSLRTFPMNEQGVIHGGWDYIYAAYVVTWLSLCAYAFYAWRQHVQAKKLVQGNASHRMRGGR